MTEPMDALNAVEAGAFQLLDAAIVGALVCQQAPQDGPLPVVIIGDMDGAVKITGKIVSRTRSVPLSIVVVTEGEERKPCNILLGQVERALGGRSIRVGDFNVTFVFERSASVLAEEGGGYVALAQFLVSAIAD